MRLTREPDAFLQRYALVLSDDRARLDMDWVLDQLTRQYWAQEEPREMLKRSIENAHPYGIYAPDGQQAGFLSVLSDHVYNARLSHFFILPTFRGRGLGRWVLSTLLHESRFSEVRNWQLNTDDKHALYERFGFRIAEKYTSFMTLKKCGS